MSSVEEFGQYVLLKKLGEDPLGEAFRAGRLGGQGVEQVVLLRIFNGRTINGPHLWQRIQGRGAVQRALRSPNLGEGVDLGEVRGIPYVAYDYISGKSLSSLLVQASTENTPIPVDHALLVAERLALALSMAHEARVEGERLLHGFVVPHLVMISNEGETRLLGFEVAPGLRDLAVGGAFGPEIGRYLSPELLAAEGGGGVDRSDDVYSLGVVLFELLTCKPLPRPGPDGGYGAIVDAAEIPQEGGPLPAEAALLVKRSLAPRPQRIADAANWHKAISKILVDGGFGATTFNLAFFMHNLFRAEIERESQEIEAEKTIEIPAQALAAGVAAAAATATAAPRPPAAAPARRPAADDTGARQRGYGVDRSGTAGGRAGLWIGVAAAALLVLGAAGYFFYFQDRGAAGTAGEPVADVAAPGTGAEALPPLVDAPPPEPAGPTPEEIQEQLTRMIESRSAEMEAKLRTQYDERIKALQDQLQATQEASARREADLREQQRLAAERRAAELKAAEERAAPADAEESARQAPPAAAPGPQVAATTTPGGPPPAATGAPPPAAGQDPAGGAGAPGRTADGAPASTSASAAAARAAPTTPPVDTRVRVGDLVAFGPGVTPPDLIRMPEPIFPTLAKRLNRGAVVEVRVLVDEKGQVQQTELAGQKAGYGFDQAAVEAAGRATYKPATKDGVRVKMWTVMKVRFEP
jgi:serine/threonine-protein kinase